MSLTSISFLLFFAISLLFYYILPKKYQGIELLIFSILFYLFSATIYTVLYLVISIVTTTISIRKIVFYKKIGEDKKAKSMLWIGIAVNLGILALLKYSNFFVININLLSSLFNWNITIHKLTFTAPMGISFYTMQIIGYLLDSYWEIITPETSFFKNALFIGYYPQLTSGPISRYQQISSQLYSTHHFEEQTVVFGLWRILWGFFKKLVLSARIGIIVDTIYADPIMYSGFYIWLAAALFMFQLYTDFSGCMDIILGTSECYGIRLPENFRTPFFSRTVQEFWQRWHITLGSWMKDYILYPILKSTPWQKLTQKIKIYFGKKAAKQIPAYSGMLCVWLLIGLWHGGSWKYILGQGLWFWLMITLSQIFSPLLKKIIAFFHINTDCFSWHLFQSLRVFCLVCFGNMFFRLNGLFTTIKTMKLGFSCWNPEIFFDGSLYSLGLDRPNVHLTVFGLGILLLVSVLNEKENIRKQLAKQNLVFRWFILLGLILSILIFGMYGPGYDASSFIYEAF